MTADLGSLLGSSPLTALDELWPYGWFRGEHAWSRPLQMLAFNRYEVLALAYFLWVLGRGRRTLNQHQTIKSPFAFTFALGPILIGIFAPTGPYFPYIKGIYRELFHQSLSTHVFGLTSYFAIHGPYVLLLPVSGYLIYDALSRRRPSNSAMINTTIF